MAIYTGWAHRELHLDGWNISDPNFDPPNGCQFSGPTVFAGVRIRL